MSNDWLPSKDADLLTFAEHASTLLDAAPLTWGLTAVQTAALVDRTADFKAALSVSTDPQTKGRLATFNKNVAKKALVSGIRQCVGQLQKFVGTTDTMRMQLGVNVPKPRERAPLLTEPPLIDIEDVTGRTVSFRLHDGTGTRRARPKHADEAIVFTHVGDEVPSDISAWMFRGRIGSVTDKVSFSPSLPPGTKVWITAVWSNTRGLSPAAEPVGKTFGAASLELGDAAKSKMKIAA